jgi:hypothetical protein
VFDRAEQGQEFNPNAAYELGRLHLLGRSCLILKPRTLRTLQTDILMKLYQPFTGPAAITNHTTEWVRKLAERTINFGVSGRKFSPPPALLPRWRSIVRYSRTKSPVTLPRRRSSEETLNLFEGPKIFN